MSWDEFIEEEREFFGDSSKKVFCTLTPEEMKVKFDEDYGSPNGKPFLFWSEERVYFPVTYDGLEYVKSVPRNPTEEDFVHLGSW